METPGGRKTQESRCFRRHVWERPANAAHVRQAFRAGKGNSDSMKSRKAQGCPLGNPVFVPGQAMRPTLC